MKLVVNILDNVLCSSKARINFNRNKIGHVVKLKCFFLTLVNRHSFYPCFPVLSFSECLVIVFFI